MTAFAPIVSENVVEAGVKASLEDWMPDYIAELERQEAALGSWTPGQIERPAIVTSAEFDNWPEDALPVVLVICGGLAGKPTRRGDSSWEAPWSVGISPIVSDQTQEDTRALVNLMGAAMRGAVLQHKLMKSSLYPDGFTSEVDWIGETFIGIPFADSRTLAAKQVLFTVVVEGVVKEWAGPREPSVEPLEAPPEGVPVKEIKVGAHLVPLAGSLT